MTENNDKNLSSITGKAMVFGEKINTDIIIASQFLEYKDVMDYCKFLMHPIRPTTWQEIQDKGNTIFVTDIDFGSGSSREQAPDAIKYAGVKAVVSESFATIFYRNSINVGLPILEVPGIIKLVKEGHELEVNLETAEVMNKTTNEKIFGKSVEPFLLNKLRKGGLIPELQAFVAANSDQL